MIRRLVWLAALLLSAGASVAATDHPGGEIEGVWRGPGSQPMRLALRYYREEVGQGRVRIRLGPEGERFVGDYLRVGPRHSEVRLRRFYVGWASTSFDAVRTSPLGNPWVRDEWSFEIFRDRLRGEVVATLIGDRGSQMRCRLVLANGDDGLAGGAKGACQTSAGEVVRFPVGADLDARLPAIDSIRLPKNEGPRPPAMK